MKEKKKWVKPDCITITKEKLREQTAASTCSRYLDCKIKVHCPVIPPTYIRK